MKKNKENSVSDLIKKYVHSVVDSKFGELVNKIDRLQKTCTFLQGEISNIQVLETYREKLKFIKNKILDHLEDEP